MIPTFSLNKGWLTPRNLTYIARIAESINANDRNREWGGEAFLRIAESSEEINVNLDRFAKASDKNTKLSEYRKSKKETRLITQEELNQGEVGITDASVQSAVTDSGFDDVISRLDSDFYINQFIELRTEIFLRAGYDVWRLLELAKQSDTLAINSLRSIKDDRRFKDLSPCLIEIINHSSMYKKLEAKLC